MATRKELLAAVGRFKAKLDRVPDPERVERVEEIAAALLDKTVEQVRTAPKAELIAEAADLRTKARDTRAATTPR